MPSCSKMTPLTVSTNQIFSLFPLALSIIDRKDCCCKKKQIHQVKHRWWRQLWAATSASTNEFLTKSTLTLSPSSDQNFSQRFCRFVFSQREFSEMTLLFVKCKYVATIIKMWRPLQIITSRYFVKINNSKKKSKGTKAIRKKGGKELTKQWCDVSFDPLTPLPTLLFSIPKKKFFRL